MKNQELQKELTIYGLHPKDYRIILEKIIGNSEISAFVAALKEDVEGLAKIFQENKNIKCYDNIMKFNLFHIAAISNNQRIVDMIYAN